MKRGLFITGVTVYSLFGTLSLTYSRKRSLNHYFSVNTSFGSSGAFLNSQLSVGTLIDPGSCGFAGLNKCVVVFTESQIIHTYFGETLLKTCGAPIIPSGIAHTRAFP
jgi:hypothetical protein